MSSRLALQPCTKRHSDRFWNQSTPECELWFDLDQLRKLGRCGLAIEGMLQRQSSILTEYRPATE